MTHLVRAFPKEGCRDVEWGAGRALGLGSDVPRSHPGLQPRRPCPHLTGGLTQGTEGTTRTNPDLPRFSGWGGITCLLIPTGKLEPLVARLMGATTATRVGDGADCLFFGGRAGGGLRQTKTPVSPINPNRRVHQMRARHCSLFGTHTAFRTFHSRPTLLPKPAY